MKPSRWPMMGIGLETEGGSRDWRSDLCLVQVMYPRKIASPVNNPAVRFNMLVFGAGSG